MRRKISFNKVLDMRRMSSAQVTTESSKSIEENIDELEKDISSIKKQMKQICMSLYCIDDNNKTKAQQLTSAVSAWALLNNKPIDSKAWAHVYNYLLDKFNLNVHKEHTVMNKKYPGYSYLDTIIACEKRDNCSYIDECNLYMLSCFTNYNYNLNKNHIEKYYPPTWTFVKIDSSKIRKGSKSKGKPKVII